MLSLKISQFKPLLMNNSKLVINIKYKTTIRHYSSSKNHLAFMKTHIIADYIEKLNNDINMVDIEDTEFECKYIQYFRLILIIILMVYMFTGPKKDKED